MRKTETVKITGTQYYLEGIKSLMDENPDFSLSKKELAESYEPGDWVPQYESTATHVELIPEPDNEHDKNAVRCEINGVQVGYVKKGSCSHVKNLLKSPDFKGIVLEKFYCGKVKKIYEDDEGKIHCETDTLESPAVHLTIIMDDNIPEQVQSAAPAASVAPVNTETPGERKRFKKLLPLFIILLVFFTSALAASPVLGIIGLGIVIFFMVRTYKNS